MRMFRLPSWISESRGCDKVSNGELEFKMAHATQPVVDIAASGLAKRKWDGDMPDLITQQAMKRTKANSWADSAIEMESEPEVMEDKAEATVDSDRVRDAIESQFSLEILLKHDELRLINQELAKCQVALEQLRRCHLIPYPTSQGTPESMLKISNGTGPALRDGDDVPEWASPFGVMDGPYSRHYAKWLIPDPRFDGQEWHQPSRAGKTVPEGRATRHSIVDAFTPANKSRSNRGTASQKLQALSSGYAQPKEKAGPCVLKRAEDSQWVKLVCIDCKRENFSSTQGFINHCRIAHRRDFKSHEEAAKASGQIIEIDEVNGGIVGEEKAPAVATGLVHPLIRGAPTDREAYVALLSRIDASMKLFEQGKLPGVSSIPTSAQSTPSTVEASRFISSPDTPYLSKFMQNKGFGGNLTDIVGEAKQKVDLDELMSHDEESDEESKTPTRPLGTDSPLAPAMRMPARAVMSSTPGRPTSSKGISPRMTFSPPAIDTDAANSPFTDHHEDVDMMGPTLSDLSPNTVASNNAPSLVSDDGEYDDGDDAESASEGEEEGSDVAEIDIEDGEPEKVVARAVIRNGAGRKEKEGKHVTFVSPVKEKERRVRK